MAKLKLTKEEEYFILAKREKEEADLPVKIGKLKHDLYSLSFLYSYKYEYDLFLDEDVRTLVNELKQTKPVIKKGTEFVCYLNKDNKESWYENYEAGEGWGIENESARWASENLEDIKKYEPSITQR